MAYRQLTKTAGKPAVLVVLRVGKLDQATTAVSVFMRNNMPSLQPLRKESRPQVQLSM